MTTPTPIKAPEDRGGGRPPASPPQQADHASYTRLLLNLLIIAIIIAMHVYGWSVTKVDLKKLATPPANLRMMVSDFLRPDVFSREQKSYRVYVPFMVPCGTDQVPQGAVGTGLTLTPNCGKAGDDVHILLEGMRPNTAGRLNWRYAEGGSYLLRPIVTGGQGHFEILTQVPKGPLGQETGQQGAEIILEWEEGAMQFSETARAVAARMLETIFLALMATSFGVLFAFPLSFLAARNIMATNPVGTAAYYIMRLVLNILRSVETLIWALVFIVWVGIGPFAGMLALVLHTVASLAKLYSEAVEQIDPGPVEAVRATGANRLQTVMFAVVPQIIPQFTAFTIYRWDINVRMSTVIGLVGGGGIGFLLIQWINLLQYRQAATAVYAIIVVVAAMDYFSGWLRAKIT